LFNCFVAVTRHFNANDATQWADWLVSVTHAQRDLLVLGKVNGVSPATIDKLNGMAYLEGWDTWATIGSIVSPDVLTQPGTNLFKQLINYSLI